MKKGYILITTMLVMIVLFVIGIAGAMLVYYGNMTSGAMINYSKAYYNADYGLQQVAYNVMNGACNCANNGCGISQTLPTGGTVQVITQSDNNNRTCFIESIGTGQTGGEVVRAITVSTGGSNWGALGVISGYMQIYGSASINGCDTQNSCQATGILYGSNASLSGFNTYTCQHVPNNPKGVYGNPAVNLTQASDIAQLITHYQSLSAVQQAIQNKVCSAFNVSSNNDGSCATPSISPPTSACSCPGGAVISLSGIQCIVNSNYLSSSCSSYYINGDLNQNSGNFTSNADIYVTGTLNINYSFSANNIYVSNGLNINTGSGLTANGNVYVTNGSLAVDSGSNFSANNVYISGSFYINSGGNTATMNSNTYYIGQTLYINGDATLQTGKNNIFYSNGITVNTGGEIEGGGLFDAFGSNGLAINMTGNNTIGTQTNPVTFIANTATLNMHGTPSIYGLLFFNNMQNLNLGNSSINGALYANNVSNFNGGNASINFNYSVLSQIASNYSNLFNPVNCYSNGKQQVMLNAVTLY